MRILLVEDEVTLAASVTRGLATEGIDVDWAADGEEGLWRASEGTYDAIVLDIMLPKLNGYQICQRLRDREIWTPILMLTAKDGEYDEAEGFEVGADDYLRKPFSLVVLVARLRSLTRRIALPRPPTFQVGDLKVDPATMAVTRAGATIDLTAREFAVLEALVRRSPQVVPKYELLDAVWGMDFEGQPNIVEVYIGYLRRKIDRPFADALIETVRGAGYRIGAATAGSQP